MRFVDPMRVEMALPDDWAEKVEAAISYVANRVETARQGAQVAGRPDEDIEKAVHQEWARAINAKSDLWSEAGKLFQHVMSGKCWYCEAKETRSDMPVDHFRPKNRVAECPDHPGYWWLAFEWTNYRYACTYCNSRRLTDESQGGKQDHFPLLNEDQRAWRRTDDLKIESPELLDPCDIHDVMLLTFLENGKASARNRDPDTEAYQRARTSIDLYHLDHPKIKRARQELFIKIRDDVNEIERLEATRPANPGVDAQIKPCKTRLIRRVHDSAPFRSAATVYLRGFRHLEWVPDLLDSI